MYYSIQNSINTKIVGKFFQSETIAHNYGHIDNPKFLNNVFLKKIDFEPIVPIPILHKKAKITDLISNVNAGGNLHLVISERLKTIIERHRKNGFQFYKTSIIKDTIEYDSYFSINMYETNMEYVDFRKSIITVSIRKKEGGTEKKLVNINSLDDFIKSVNFHKEREEFLFINNISLNSNIGDDFFMLRYVEGGIKYVVSEKLKKEIEESGCTGIEFQPVELSFDDWMMSGGEREKKYGKT